MQPQTRRQKEVLEIITRYIKNHGHKPSYQQIARDLGVSSKAGIAKHIQALEAQGLLMRHTEDGKFNLKLPSDDPLSQSIFEIEWLDVPKDENLAEEWENEPLFVPQFMIGYQDEARIRAFRVPDDTMLDAHICEGDVVLIEKRAYARDGDIVVAVIPNKPAVLHQYFRDGAKIELRPANPGYESIILSADKVEVCGTLHSVLRPAR